MSQDGPSLYPRPLRFSTTFPARQRVADAIFEVETRYTFWEADLFGEQGAELR